MATATVLRPPGDTPVRTRLADGSCVLIRRLEPSDGPALMAALENADPMDLRRRFMGMPPPSSVILDRLGRADGVHDYALGAFTDSGRLIAVAQFDRGDDAPTAEFAIEVASDWQRRGLGSRMLERLTAIARDIGITRFTATYYADNLPVRRLLHDSGHVIASGFDQGEGYAVLDLMA
jgi:RimJ/RimL family protein N-acetyltransferase